MAESAYLYIDDTAGAIRDAHARSSAEIAYIGLGSNLGDRMAHLEFAVDRLAEACDSIVVSHIYETTYVGEDHGRQPPFLNCVARVSTGMAPRRLLAFLREIEEARGKQATDHWRPRTLDLDILLYGSLTLDDPDLQIPHPRMWARAFVLVPLLDLEPTIAAPDGTPVRELIGKLLEQGQAVRPYRVGAVSALAEHVHIRGSAK